MKSEKESSKKVMAEKEIKREKEMKVKGSRGKEKTGKNRKNGKEI